jgi:colanic acid biosynthesis protein WcaH
MKTESNKNNFIPGDIYDEIKKLMPIVSVEALIIKDNALMFLRRENQPAKGEWWFPGGGIRKGESLEQALRREVTEETGLEISSYKLINVYSRIFPERHDITIAYLCKIKEGKVTLNNEHSEYSLFTENPAGLHPYLIETVRDSKWKHQSS